MHNSNSNSNAVGVEEEERSEEAQRPSGARLTHTSSNTCNTCSSKCSSSMAREAEARHHRRPSGAAVACGVEEAEGGAVGTEEEEDGEGVCADSRHRQQPTQRRGMRLNSVRLSGSISSSTSTFAWRRRWRCQILPPCLQCQKHHKTQVGQRVAME